MPAGDQNVLFLFTDQQRADMTYPGGPDCETPTLDRLAADGARFDNAYTPTAICSPARTSVLTGRYPHGHGVLNNVHAPDAVRDGPHNDVPSYAERLQEAGTLPVHVGKWHVSERQSASDFRFEDLGDPFHEAAFREHQRSLGVDPDDALRDDAQFVEYEGGERITLSATFDGPPEAHLEHFVTSRAIKRLGEFAESGEQFHLRVNYRGPHYPYVAPEPYASMYDPDEIDPWPSYEEDFTGKPAIHERHSAYRFPGGHGDWRDRWAEAVAKYHGFLTFLDDQFGRLLDALEDCGLADQTVVVHAADHGDFAGGHRQFNKGPLMYEDTYRVPLLVRWPGVTDGGVRDEFVVLQDLMPTFCDLGGADAPDSTHSRSLVPLLRDEVDDWRDQVVSEYHGDEFGLYSQRMVRWDDYKFVFNYPDRNELYDLGADPHELENRIDDPEYADVTAEGAERLREWMDATGDPNARWGGQILDL